MNRNWKRAIIAALVLAGTTTTIGGGQIAVAGSCPARTTSRPFTAWGDTNDYFVVPGATFESSHGWALNGNITVVNDQEPWKINGSAHARSLNIPAYATAIAPNMCIASNEDSLRLFYKDPGVAGASMQIKIEAWNTRNPGARSIVTNMVSSSGAGWKLTPRIALPNQRDAAGEQWVTITITPVNNAATWRVDDVMLDPWISR